MSSLNFKPTQEQLDIVEAFKTTRVLKVNACAGSGKTSTLKLLAAENKQPSLLMAFNKAIADEAAKQFPAHVSCRTMNSVAFAEFGSKLQHKLNFNKNPKLNTLRSIKNIVDWFSLGDYGMATPEISARVIAAMARDTVDRFCHSSREEISELDLYHKEFKELSKSHNYDEQHLGKVIVNLAKLIWKERINPISVAASTHDTYLKLWSLSNPKLNYDILYVDEAQDINACVLHVLQQQTCKVLYVGDQHQSIYAFRGATNAMKSIEAPTLYLSQSWRYGEKIAKVAETLLAKYKGVVKGNPNIKSKVRKVRGMKNYTMIFRTNSALLEQAELLIDKGIKISVEVNVPDLIRQINSAVALKRGEKPFHDSISRFGNWYEMLEFAKESVETRRLVNIVERKDVKEFCALLEKANTKGTTPDVILTTAHKSKGLEFDNVIVADDFKFGTNDWLDIPEQEINLLYVACTRAKLNLQVPDIIEINMRTEEE